MKMRRFQFRDFFAARRHIEPFIANPPKFRHSSALPVKGRSKIELTKGIKDFADSFPNTVAGIRAMVDAIGHFKLVPSKYARLAYGTRTADDIIATRMIPTVVKHSIASRGYAAQIGCVDMCDALIAAFHANGIAATHVRSVRRLQEFFKMERRQILEKILGHNVPHSYVRFHFLGKQLLADPFTTAASEKIIVLDQKAIGLINLLKSIGKLKEGRDSWDEKIGLYTFWDYKNEKDQLSIGKRKNLGSGE